MTKEELIQAISDDKMMPFIQPEQLAQIVAFVINNYKLSLPSDLDEAAIKYGHEEPILPEDYNDGDIPDYERWTAEAFKAGAEWMAGQGCTVEVDEGYFINNPHNDRRKGKFHKYYSSVFGHSEKITVTPGDNLVVQIRKK